MARWEAEQRKKKGEPEPSTVSLVFYLIKTILSLVEYYSRWSNQKRAQTKGATSWGIQPHDWVRWRHLQIYPGSEGPLSWRMINAPGGFKSPGLWNFTLCDLDTLALTSLWRHFGNIQMQFDWHCVCCGHPGDHEFHNTRYIPTIPSIFMWFALKFSL